MVTDPIADMLNRVMNAARVGKPQVVVDYSGAKFAIANVLKNNGYLLGVSKKAKRNRNFICLDIAYSEDGKPVISKVQRVSKPSRRIYEKADGLRPVRQGFGISVVSTPKGVMTDKEARRAKVGGEVMCKVW